jgi:hypothetical protein
MVRKMELFDAMVRKKELVVAIVGRHGAFGHGQEDKAFGYNCQEEGACCCYGQKEWSLLDIVRKKEPFYTMVRKKEEWSILNMVRKMEMFVAAVRRWKLFVAKVRRNGAFWTWSGRRSF